MNADDRYYKIERQSWGSSLEDGAGGGEHSTESTEKILYNVVVIDFLEKAGIHVEVDPKASHLIRLNKLNSRFPINWRHSIWINLRQLKSFKRLSCRTNLWSNPVSSMTPNPSYVTVEHRRDGDILNQKLINTNPEMRCFVRSKTSGEYRLNTWVFIKRQIVLSVSDLCCRIFACFQSQQLVHHCQWIDFNEEHFRIKCDIEVLPSTLARRERNLCYIAQVWWRQRFLALVDWTSPIHIRHRNGLYSRVWVIEDR